MSQLIDRSLEVLPFLSHATICISSSRIFSILWFCDWRPRMRESCAHRSMRTVSTVALFLLRRQGGLRSIRSMGRLAYVAIAKVFAKVCRTKFDFAHRSDAVARLGDMDLLNQVLNPGTIGLTRQKMALGIFANFARIKLIVPGYVRIRCRFERIQGRSA